MAARQRRKRPGSSGQPSTGTLSCQAFGGPQAGQRDPGRTTDSWRGTRWMTTLANEPASRPSSPASSAAARGLMGGSLPADATAGSRPSPPPTRRGGRPARAALRAPSSLPAGCWCRRVGGQGRLVAGAVGGGGRLAVGRATGTGGDAVLDVEARPTGGQHASEEGRRVGGFPRHVVLTGRHGGAVRREAQARLGRGEIWLGGGGVVLGVGGDWFWPPP